jgi:hypothetical protein
MTWLSQCMTPGQKQNSVFVCLGERQMCAFWHFFYGIFISENAE